MPNRYQFLTAVIVTLSAQDPSDGPLTISYLYRYEKENWLAWTQYCLTDMHLQPHYMLIIQSVQRISRVYNQTRLVGDPAPIIPIVIRYDNYAVSTV